MEREVGKRCRKREGMLGERKRVREEDLIMRGSRGCAGGGGTLQTKSKGRGVGNVKEKVVLYN